MEKNQQVVVSEVQGQLDRMEMVLVIKSDADFDLAVLCFQGMKKLAKQVKERKEELTKPLNAALKAWRAVFAPFEERLEKEMDKQEQKILAYKSRKDAAAEKKAAEIAGKVERGEMDQEKAVAKLENVKGAEITTGSHVRGYKALEIYDDSVLPREFLVPDTVKITNALKGGAVVPGARLVEKKSLV